MKILVVNCGSSSLKYQLIDMDNEKWIAKGVCERIKVDGTIKGSTADGRSFENPDAPMSDHTQAFSYVMKALTEVSIFIERRGFMVPNYTYHADLSKMLAAANQRISEQNREITELKLEVEYWKKKYEDCEYRKRIAETTDYER